MAVLSDADRATIWRALQRYLSQEGEVIACSKTLGRTLINETDAWLEDNRTGYLAALSENNLTGSQIAWMFACVALMRKGDAAAQLARLLGVEVG